MRALLFVLSEQQDCRPGAGYDGADDGVGGGDAAFHDAGDDKQGDGLKPDEHCGDGGGKVVEGDARKPDAPGLALRFPNAGRMAPKARPTAQMPAVEMALR